MSVASSNLFEMFRQPEVPKELQEKFRASTTLANCRRLKPITWIVFSTLLVFLLSDVALLDVQVMEGVWEFLVGARVVGLFFCVVVFALLGPLGGEEDLKPYHAYLWQAFVFFFVIYGAAVVGALYPYKGDVGPYYVFLIGPYAFLCWTRRQATFMLLLSIGAIFLSVYTLLPDPNVARFQLVYTTILAWASLVISHLIYHTYYRAFMDKQLIQRKNAQLKIAMSKAEAASRAKTDFMAAMSHEIRTPMNSILGMTEVALHSGLSNEQRDYIEAAHESGLHLMDIINELLDFSRIEARQLRLISAHFDLPAVVDSALRTIRLQADGKGVALEFELMDDVPRFLKGDPGRLRQVLINLLNNAVKFTEHGSVRVTVGLWRGADQESDRPVGLQFSVKDTGVGIDKEKVDGIFDAFSQGDGSSSRSYGGTGLGLAICKELVALMGGWITASSKVGHGSEFVFTAAFGKGDGGRAMEADVLAASWNVHLPIKPSKILLVDDNPLNVKVTKLHLDRMNMETSVAESGTEALLLLAEEDFDLVLMDLEMPGMDGYETTRRIRSGEGAGKDVRQKDVPILAVTAHALGEVRVRCEETGMNGFVTKPVGSGELGAAMRRILGGHWRSPDRPRDRHVAEVPVLDLVQAAGHLGVSRAEMNHLVPKAMEEIAVKFSLAEKGIQSGTLREVALQAHTLKSVSASIGAEATRRAAVKLENASRRDDAMLSAKRLGDLSVEIARLEAAVGALPSL